jgi:hypothetical protein
MKESSRIKFGLTPDGGANTYTAQLELKVSVNERWIGNYLYPSNSTIIKFYQILQNYKAKDSGTYTCNIKNDAGEANVELTLNIEGYSWSLNFLFLT